MSKTQSQKNRDALEEALGKRGVTCLQRPQYYQLDPDRKNGGERGAGYYYQSVGRPGVWIYLGSNFNEALSAVSNSNVGLYRNKGLFEAQLTA